MKYCIYIILFLQTINVFGQKPFREIIETDSSTIEIIRNSVYRCYEETYKFRDSIWWNVTYIDDTTQLHTEGWKTKSGKHLGTWREFNRQGKLMYTWNHDKGICEVNPKLFPYHDLLKKMKLKADSLIIKAYSKEFFRKHVVFDFDCSTYGFPKQASANRISKYTSYSGSWTEPMKYKPIEFLFRYDIKYDSTEIFNRAIELELDSLGRFIPRNTKSIYGFEKLSQYSPRLFSINKTNALRKLRDNGFNICDTVTYSCYLCWESFNEPESYCGRYRYYVAVKTGEIKDIAKKDNTRSRIEEKFKVYVFNPWTGEFIESKKMKSVREWGKNSGFSIGLVPDE